MQSLNSTTTEQKDSGLKYGNMTIPSKLVFYQKTYIYAMVPLAPKLAGRNKFQS